VRILIPGIISCVITELLLLGLLLAPDPPLKKCELALWAVGAGPKPEVLDVKVLGVQEANGAAAGRKAWHDADSEIWVKQLGKEDFAIALVNRTNKTVSVDVVFLELGVIKGPGEWPRVRDILARKDRGKVHAGFAERLEGGECALFRVKP